jgi:hypothetical protein
MIISEHQLHFVLAPDSSVARRLRRNIAASNARIGLVVGTWQELIECACNSYLIDHSTNQWNQYFGKALESISNAFWCESLQVAEEEARTVIEGSLSELIGASDPSQPFEINHVEKLHGRPKQHLLDLKRLFVALDNRLPPEYATLSSVFNTSSQDAIRKILVYTQEDFPRLNQWQSSLVTKLNEDANTSFDPVLLDQLKSVVMSSSTASKSTGLYALQEKLFSSPGHKTELDDSVQWVGVRDYLSEAEIAAGMVQSVLKDHPNYQLNDIGLLVPDSYEYSLAINDTFSMAGLPLSGLVLENWQRDLGREALFHFLYCRQKPAPAMALAVCLSSFLMPWSPTIGAQLAQQIMDGDYRMNHFSSANSDDRAMLDLIRSGDDDPQSLLQAIKKFVSLLSKEESFTQHVQQAKLAADQVCAMLEGEDEVDWSQLRRVTAPKYIIQGNSEEYTQEGITVWREGREAWRPVRHLIVLGFAARHYPLVARSSSVFEEEDLEKIKSELGFTLDTSRQKLQRARSRLKRQLSSVIDSVTFLVPRRNTNGDSQMPSESIVFMQALFEENNNRILEIDSAADREKIRYLPIKESEAPQPPRPIVANDIQCNRNLLELLADEEGDLKPESPSSLETLLVSRLAWLLRRLNAEPKSWAPERSNVLLLGNLAHDVFEYIFKQDLAGLDTATIPTQVETFLDIAIAQHGPFLQAPQWQVERIHLCAEITKAVLNWIDVLQKLNAEVLGCESWLHGKFHHIPIHGKADILLGLPNDHVLIVDYKRSSANSRRPRMKNGYDSQASLYRTMLTTGGLKDRSDQDVVNRLSHARHIGIVYYTLNDQTLLADGQLQQSRSIAGWESFTNDISELAIHWIERRLDEVSSGLIMLNREGDAEFFDKQAGLKPYALEGSPLITLFTLPGDAQEAI